MPIDRSIGEPSGTVLENLDNVATPRVQNFPAALDARVIDAHLARESPPWDVRTALRVDSTNSVLMREARARGDAFAQPVLLAAELQTAGRGRQGRTWRAAPGASLCVSFGWRIDRVGHALSGLGLVCGLAVRSVLAGHGATPDLKWPNDVLLRGRKLAGILVEAIAAGRSGESNPATLLVIGVGINLLAESHRALESEGHVPSLAATDLATESGAVDGFRLDRNLLAAELASALATCLARFEDRGFAGFESEWNSADAYRGAAVQIADGPAKVARGIARGVDSLGRLCLETGEGLRKFAAGELSLRPD